MPGCEYPVCMGMGIPDIGLPLTIGVLEAYPYGEELIGTAAVIGVPTTEPPPP